MSVVVDSLLRVTAIARNTWHDAVRQRAFALLLFFALALIGGSLFLREFNFGDHELRFLTDFGFASLAFFGSLLTIILVAQGFFSELENRTALTLLSKPVHRHEFLTGKLVGSLGVVAVFCVVLLALLWLVLWSREIDLAGARSGGEHAPAIAWDQFLAAGALQFLKFAVLGALVLFIGSFAQSLLTCLGLSCLALLICHLVYLSKLGTGASGVLTAAGTLAAVLFPDFQLYGSGESVLVGQASASAGLPRLLLYSAGYAVTYLGLATLNFRHREV